MAPNETVADRAVRAGQGRVEVARPLARSSPGLPLVGAATAGSASPTPDRSAFGSDSASAFVGNVFQPVALLGPMPLEERVVATLRRRSLTLACAESCTGGLVAARLTRAAGASDVFRGGVVAYKDDVKASLLGVDAKLLAQRGAVTREAALQMARGARELLGADIAVAVTGFAGPSVPPGGELGLVFIALAHGGGDEVHELHFKDEREAVRAGAAERALEYVLAAVEKAVKASA